MEHAGSQFNIQEFDFAYPEGVESHYWPVSRNFLLTQLIKKEGLHADPILEIGCGKGYVVAALRSKGIPCWGVELADIPAMPAAAGFVTSNTDAIKLDPSFRNQIKVLLLLDVLEHIQDPVAFVKQLLPFFPHATRLIVSVPARQEIWSNYDEFYRHYRRYNLDDIAKDLNRADFNVRSAYYIFHTLYYLARLKFVFGNTRPVKINAPKGFAKVLHRLVAAVLIVESILLPGSLRGSSIFCVASKNA